MQIIGFIFTKILSERQEKFEDKLEVKQNLNIDDITEDKYLKIKLAYYDLIGNHYNYLSSFKLNIVLDQAGKPHPMLQKLSSDYYMVQ